MARPDEQRLCLRLCQTHTQSMSEDCEQNSALALADLGCIWNKKGETSLENYPKRNPQSPMTCDDMRWHAMTCDDTRWHLTYRELSPRAQSSWNVVQNRVFWSNHIKSIKYFRDFQSRVFQESRSPASLKWASALPSPLGSRAQHFRAVQRSASRREKENPGELTAAKQRKQFVKDFTKCLWKTSTPNISLITGDKAQRSRHSADAVYDNH